MKAQLTQITVDDYEELSTFLAKFPGETRTRDFWKSAMAHWWDSNPAFSESIPKGWRLTANKRLVGFLGNVPSLFQLNGTTSTAYNATTWRVLPDYRSHSLRLFSKLMQGTAESIVFVTSPSQTALKVLDGLEFKPMPGATLSSSIAVTAPERFLQRLIPSMRGAEPTKALIGKAAKKLSGLIPHRGTQPTSDFDVRLLPAADRQFDDLWERTRQGFDYTRVRTAAAVNWHRLGRHFSRKVLFGCYQGSELVGYMICLDNARARLRPLECLDIWTVPPHQAPVSALLVAALQYAIAERCGVVRVPHFKSFVKNACEEIGMMFRKPSESMVYARASTRFASSLHATNSYLAMPHADSGP